MSTSKDAPAPKKPAAAAKKDAPKKDDKGPDEKILSAKEQKLEDAAEPSSGDASAAQAVLDRDLSEPAVEQSPSLAETSAQRVLDEGGASAPSVGDATVPTETLDGHTVDPSGTADDTQPGVASVNTEASVPLDVNSPHSGDDQNPLTIDQRIDPADRNKGVAANLPTEFAEDLMTQTVKRLAKTGFPHDVVHQWVDQAYADLQGERSTAKSAGEPDPFPLYVG